MVVNDEAVLDAVLSSPWEQGQARAELSGAPEGAIEAEVSDAIDVLGVDAAPFDDVTGDETMRVPPTIECYECSENREDVAGRGRDVCWCWTADAQLVVDTNGALDDYYFDREAEARHERYEAGAGR